MAGLEAIKRIYASHSMAESTYIKVKRINSPCPTVEPTSTWRVLAQVLAHLGANLPCLAWFGAEFAQNWFWTRQESPLKLISGERVHGSIPRLEVHLDSHCNKVKTLSTNEWPNKLTSHFLNSLP